MKVTKEYLKQLIREAIEMEAKSDFVPGDIRKAKDPTFDDREKSDAQELGEMFSRKAIQASAPGGIAPRAVQFIKSNLGNETNIDDSFASDFVYGMYIGFKRDRKVKPEKADAYSSQEYRARIASAIAQYASK